MADNSTVELKDLDATQKMVLYLIGDQPDYKPTNACLRAANYLGALGLATYIGGLRFELTAAGKELFRERQAFFGITEEQKSEKSISEQQAVPA